MRNVYTQYFQKSKVFLYPLLNLKKGIDFVPQQTYVAWDKVYDSQDMKFMCLYTAKMGTKFIIFQEKYLFKHPLLESYFNLGEDQHLFVFDFSKYKHDYMSFINGKYSKFSINTRDRITNFFGKVGNISEYVTSFLNPEDYHELYADNLGVDVSIIQQVHELCSIPNMEKETLFTNVPEEIELFNNNLISLDKY